MAAKFGTSRKCRREPLLTEQGSDVITDFASASLEGVNPPFDLRKEFHVSPTAKRVISWTMAACLVTMASGEDVPPAAATASPKLDAVSAQPAEPSFEIANTWWPPLENVYTPIGWKNHLFRFNVYYSGVVMAQTQPEQDVEALRPWRDLAVQVSILSSEKGLDPDRWRGGTYQMTTDNGRRWTYQGMLDRPTPVVWNEWRSSFRATIGYVLREEVFAHVSGGRESETGREPLFAWIRMSIREVNPIMNPDPCYILVRINKPHIFPEMYRQRNCALRRTDALYPRPLELEKLGDADKPGCLIIEQGDKIRLGVLPGRATELRLDQPKGDEQDTNLHVVMAVEKGNYVDLLLPMLPAGRDLFMKEMHLGRNRALAQCDAYWSKLPPTAATIDTPEPWVNEFLRRNAQYGEIIAQKMPDSGFYTNLTGSQVYARMWATPTTMFDTMLLDTLGYHQAVDRYLEIFRVNQGKVKPPGPAYDLHPGYFGGPKSLGTVSWLTDHGAILHAAGYHALVTNDRAFIDHWLEPIVKGCEWIRDACARTDHDGVHGLPPAATATDRHVATQAVWNIGWHYRGLISAVQLLEREGHPRAEEFAQLASDYRKTFVSALRKATAANATWTDREGQSHFIVPTSLSAGGDYTHPFYLDTGPLFLVYAGLLDASDPMMQSTLKFFREGPNWTTFDRYGTHEQPAVLVHEISSCEPPSSFNLFHSHQLGDRQRFLEGMYSMMAGAHSRKTFTTCETRGGITGLAAHIDVYAVKLCVIDDFVESDELHLLRMTPKAWLKTDHLTRFKNVPTIFGPVTVRFQLAEGGRVLYVRYDADFHHAPKKVVLHVPPLPSIERVRVNGRSVKAGGGGLLTLEQ